MKLENSARPRFVDSFHPDNSGQVVFYYETLQSWDPGVDILICKVLPYVPTYVLYHTNSQCENILYLDTVGRRSKYDVVYKYLQTKHRPLFGASY